MERIWGLGSVTAVLRLCTWTVLSILAAGPGWASLQNERLGRLGFAGPCFNLDFAENVADFYGKRSIESGP
jgi:hypothetical protein